VTAADGAQVGRIKDVYFDDQTWTIKHLVLSVEPRTFVLKQVLIDPRQVLFSENTGVIRLNIAFSAVQDSPLAASVLPVCHQYAALAYASPGSGQFARGLGASDPHLRSARAVAHYRINAGGEFGGTLADFIFDSAEWLVRYLAVEQIIERRKLLFHVLPQSVERFTWASQRILLRSLQPVLLEMSESAERNMAAA